MTDIVPTPTPPTVPQYPALGSANFNTEAYNYGSNMPSVVAGIVALVQACWTNATAANERATAAAASANTAGAQATNAATAKAGAEAARDAANAQAANASAAAAAAGAAALQVDKRYLGSKASAPTTDNQGAALQDGAIYYDSTAKKVMTWTGDSWVAGIASVGGVASFNGQTGAVNVTLPAITDLGNGDLTAATAAGFYRFGAPAAGAPAALTNAQMLVLRGPSNTATLAQLAVGSDGALYSRGVSGMPGAPVASAWRRMVAQNDPCVSTGGAMDLALGSRFAIVVNGSVSLSFANVPVDSVCALLEIHYVAGSFALPAGSIWAGGTVPAFATGKRHLLYFERCIAGSTAGWYVSALTGFAA
ncbi:hypothetical protein [Paracidovorax cattleyae]|uniref:hypothetical protein n=1 Tax=Paracidovorax cattleyae TaxID=80868 RepID=UPI0018AFC5FC|nr:hypothetical protein [Paracidovorax cattleyae]MBF9263941.1 hypothetical protein [Paracidovorax cattleyae]UYL85491.1 pyocin knob domain-containing protein [Acidovorax phage Aval]